MTMGETTNKRNEWPAAGITHAGQWGTRDGLTWEHVEGELTVSPDGYTTGAIVRTPDDARYWMREAVRGL